MLSINTNLSSIIAQNSMKQSTNALNQAIERMSTGFKINHAKDNAANYSISTNMTTKINAYQIAEENAAMGLDLVTTASSTLDLVSEHVQRIRDLCEQASNGTYGEESLKAIQSEIDARQQEVDRILAQTEYNGIKMLEGGKAEGVTGSFIAPVTQLTEEQAIAQGYTVIKTADQLQAMKDNLSGKYILMNDIDLAGYNWTPVGNSSNEFTGELNGNGYVIKNLTIDNSSEDKQALFGYTSGAKISNLGIEQANIKGQNLVGILVGFCYGAEIDNVYAQGSVSGNICIGGLVGEAENTGSTPVNITNCYTDINIGGNQSVGGIVGCNNHNGPSIKNCFSKGTVSGTQYVGGIVGGNNGAEIKDSYTMCSVSCTGSCGSVGIFSPEGSSGNIYYLEQGISSGLPGSSSSYATAKTASELQAMIDNGTLVSAAPPTAVAGDKTITLQIGTMGDNNSQISFVSSVALDALSINVSDSDTARGYLTTIDNYLAKISAKQTEYGAIQNRLESALEEISVQYDNLVSSRSTLRDADIAEESSKYIQAQILQQASATLMSTANQSPSIALQLI